MSAESRVASRYAKALLEQAVETNVVDAIKNDIVDFIEVCKENRALTNSLSSPLIKSDKKAAVLSALFKGKYQELTLKFFRLVCKKERTSFLPSMAVAFVEEYNVLNSIQPAELIMATPVSRKVESEFVRVVTELTNRKADLDQKVDPSLIGGFVLKIGDKQFDDSVKTKLGQLKRQFSNN